MLAMISSLRSLNRLLGPTLLTVISVSCPVACIAQGVFLSVGTGIGDVSVNENYRLDNSRTSDDNWVTEFAVGYVFASNVVVEGGGVRGLSGNWFFGDQYEFKDDRVMAGYSFQVGQRFRIVPELGLSFWDLHASEGSFFSSPDEEQDFSGEDWVWRISGELHRGNRLSLYFSYTNARHDFGRVSLPSLGVKFQF